MSLENKIEVNLNDTCRACLLKKENMKNLFTETEEIEYLLEKLSAISDLEIVLNETLPCYLCSSCELKLEIAYEFQVLCQKSNELIIQCLASDTPVEVGLDSDKTHIEAVQISSHAESENKDSKRNIEEINKVEEYVGLPKVIIQKKRLMQYPKEEVMKAVREIQENFSKPTRCIICDFESLNRKCLSIHMTKMHREDKKHWCIFCNALFPNIKLHLEETHWNNCVPCKFCNKKFRVTSHLIEHLFFHSDIRQFTCSICNNSFVTSGHLKIHVKGHINDKKYKCPVCPKQFIQMVSLKLHLKTHNLTCKKCNQKFSNSKKYEVHECTQEIIEEREDQSNFMHDPEENNGVMIENEIDVIKKDSNMPTETVQDKLLEKALSNVEKKSGICEACNKKVKNLTRHNLQHHSNQPKSEKKHLCTYCGKSFNFAGRLTVHTRIHTGHCPYKCQYCQKGFTTRSQQVHHERTHTGEKPHICSVCGRGFTQSSILKTHMKLHTGRPEQCMLCSKRFCRPSELKIHMRWHTGERPYKCDVCNQTFIQVCNLTDHMKLHSDRRAYKCSFCEKAFKRNSTLKSHEQIHIGKKPFECEYCSFSCRQNYSLTRHILSTHGVSKHKCEYCDQQFDKANELQSHLTSHQNYVIRMDPIVESQ